MKNKAKYISRIEWFCITVIVTVLACSILPSLLPISVSKACDKSPFISPAQSIMGVIARYQHAYYLEHEHFASSMQELEPNWPLGNEQQFIKNNWEISFQTKDDIAFAYAVAKYTNPNQRFYSYVAATTAPGRNDNGLLTVCRTLEPSTAQPAAPMLQESQQFIFWRHDAKLFCSSGTEVCI
jgi:Tfp pilus assembly protein PilE